MPEVWLELDTALKERLRRALDDPQRPVTEAELRRLSEEGRACTLILGAELERLERQLAELDGDPGSSLGAIAEVFRRVHDFRLHLEELGGLLSALEGRAREARTSWLFGESASGPTRPAPRAGGRSSSESRRTPGPAWDQPDPDSA